MTTFIFKNNATSTLAGAITSVSVNANLAPGSGILFPNPSTGQVFSATMIDAATQTLNEIAYVTAIATDTVTMLRGQEGTTPLNWLAGDFFIHQLTAGQMGSFLQSVASPNAPRIVTLSGVFTTNSTDGAIGLQRTTSLAASSTTLPGSAAIGQMISYSDLIGNFQPYPVTINAPGGMTISNQSSIVLNVNHNKASFTYYGSNFWDVGGVY
jgi:hypothetical protein